MKIKLMSAIFAIAIGLQLQVRPMEGQGYELVQVLPEPRSIPAEKFFSVAITSDGRTIVTGSPDTGAKVWDIQGNKWVCIAILSSNQDSPYKRVSSVAITPDGQTIVIGSIDGKAEVWRLQNNEWIFSAKLARDDGFRQGILSVAITSDGQRIVMGLEDGNAKVFDFKSNEWSCFAVFDRDSHHDYYFAISSVAITPDKQTIVTGSRNGIVKVWELQENEWVRTAMLGGRELYPQDFESIAISSDGKTIVCAPYDVHGYNTAQVWKFEDNRWCSYILGSFRNWCQNRRNRQNERLCSVAIIQNEQKIVTGSENGIVTVWDLQDGEWIRITTLFEQSGGPNCIKSIGATPDGQIIIVGLSDCTVKIWQRKTA